VINDLARRGTISTDSCAGLSAPMWTCGIRRAWFRQATWRGTLSRGRFIHSLKCAAVAVDRHWSSSTYHSSQNRDNSTSTKVGNTNGVPWFTSLQYKFNVQVPQGYSFQPMSVRKDYFVTTPNADEFVDFCVHTASKSTTHLI